MRVFYAFLFELTENPTEATRCLLDALISKINDKFYIQLVVDKLFEMEMEFSARLCSALHFYNSQFSFDIRSHSRSHAGLMFI